MIPAATQIAAAAPAASFHRSRKNRPTRCRSAPPTPCRTTGRGVSPGWGACASPEKQRTSTSCSRRSISSIDCGRAPGSLDMAARTKASISGGMSSRDLLSGSGANVGLLVKDLHEVRALVRGHARTASRRASRRPRRCRSARRPARRRPARAPCTRACPSSRRVGQRAAVLRGSSSSARLGDAEVEHLDEVVLRPSRSIRNTFSGLRSRWMIRPVGSRQRAADLGDRFERAPGSGPSRRIDAPSRAPRCTPSRENEPSGSCRSR